MSAILLLVDSHTRPGTRRLINDCNGSGGNRQLALARTGRIISILLRASPCPLRRLNNLVHLQLLSSFPPVQSLRESPRRDVTKYFLEDNLFFVDLVILHQRQLQPFPACNILKANTASRIRALAPNRAVALRRLVPPEHPKPRHFRAAPLRPILLDHRKPSRSRAPNNLSLTCSAVRRSRIRRKRFLDRPCPLKGPQQPFHLRSAFQFGRNLRRGHLSLTTLGRRTNPHHRDQPNRNHSKMLHRDLPPLCVLANPSRP